MSDQEKPAGWRVLINRRAEGGAINQTTYLVAIPEKDLMTGAVCEQLKLGALELVHCEPVSAIVLREHGVKAGQIFEVMVVGPRGTR